jgi:hypothetical protein
MGKRSAFLLVILLILACLLVYQMTQTRPERPALQHGGKGSKIGSQQGSRDPSITPHPGGADRGDLLIVPGERVGAIRLGDAIDDVVRRFGNVEISPRKDFLIYSLRHSGMDIGVRRDRVAMILVSSPRFRTREGIAVGGTMTPVIQAFGREYEYTQVKSPDVDYKIDYWNRGIAFSAKRDRIVRIRVFSTALDQAPQ